ncbi:MAG: hypothetical protein WAW02_02910 [Sideroxyarcus sp.]
MASFEVREIFRLPNRNEFVIAGTIAEGKIIPGMVVSVWIDSKLYWHIPVKNIEYIDRVALNESLVGLVCAEANPNEAMLCSDLCPLGTIVEVKEHEIAT